MTKRRGLVALVVPAAIGLTLAGVAAPAATRRAPTRPRVRTITVMPFHPSNCYLAGQTCSIHPCVQLIAGSPAPRSVPEVVIPRLATPACKPRPAATGQRWYVAR
jgi:hypothetical protein